MTSLEPNPHPVTYVPAKTADITLRANIDLEPDVDRVTLPRVDVTGVLHLPEEVKAPHPFLSEYQIPLFTVSDTALSAIRVALVNGINHANDLLEVWEKHGGSSTRMTTRLLETLNKEIEQMEAARDTLNVIMYGKEQPTVEE